MPTPSSINSTSGSADTGAFNTALPYSKELGRVHVMPNAQEMRYRRFAGVLAAAIAALCAWKGFQIERQQEFLGSVRSGDIAAVRTYLAGGGAAGVKGLDGHTALEIAATRGDATTTDLLLRSGAPVTLEALNGAAVRGNGNVLYSLLQRSDMEKMPAADKGKILCSAAQSGDMESVKLLLHRGAPTTFRNTLDDAMTPLMYAARSGKPGVVYTLLEAGADLKARTAKGASVLMLASAWNAPVTCQYLIKNGADVNATDKQGNTALMLASNVGNVETANLLIGYGASVNAHNSAGKSVIAWAIEGGNDRVINLLHHHGAHS